MKFITLSSASLVLLAISTGTIAKKESHNKKSLLRRHRQLQFGWEDLLGGLPGDNDNDNDESSPFGSSPLDDMLDDLSAGLEELLNMTQLISMDPLVLQGGSIVLNDTINITSCTSPINVTAQPFTLTGLSTIAMERFELVPNSDTETNNWWSGFMAWSGTFDMLLTAGSLIMEGGFSLESDDLTCLGQGAPTDGFFSTGVKISLINPVLEMLLEIGGNTPTGFFNTFVFGEETQTDSIETNNVTFSYDTWTIEFDNPEINQTIHVGDLISTVDAFLSNAPNLTDLLAGMDGLDGIDGIDTFFQEQTNIIMKNSQITF